MSDPFHVLGLDASASPADVRDARRRLAAAHHPDRGGDPATMQAVNEAADAALRAIQARRTSGPFGGSGAPSSPSAPSPPSGPAPSDPARPGTEPTRVARDVPSFTVEALPAETFEALLIVASSLGEVLDDEPPYRLDTYLTDPFDCWCRLEVVPDAGASTVSLTVAGLDGRPAPDLVAVRDAWVAALNGLDWP